MAPVLLLPLESQSRNSLFEAVLPRRRLHNLDLSKHTSILFNDLYLYELHMTLVEVYTPCVCREPSAPHTSHEPFSPGPILTFVLRRAIAHRLWMMDSYTPQTEESTGCARGSYIIV